MSLAMTPENATPAHWALGRLSWDAVPMAHEPIVLWTFIAVVLGGIAVMALITKFRLWGTLWRDWICSIDHKKIGIMYMILGLVMLLRGFADAVMMRLQQAMAFGDNMGYLPPHHYDQIFTAHGVIMIFFVAMPLAQLALISIKVSSISRIIIFTSFSGSSALSSMALMLELMMSRTCVKIPMTGSFRRL